MTQAHSAAQARSAVADRNIVWRSRVLAGTAAVMLGVGTGRWGAYVRVGSIYLTDVLLVLAAGLALVAAICRGRNPSVSERSWPGIVILLLVFWTGSRFVLGPDHSMTAIRDFAPYGYGMVALLSAYAYHHSDADAQRRTLRLLELALYVRLSSVMLAVGLPSLVALAPVVDVEQGLRAFTLRPGSDGTVLGVAAALWALRYLSTGKFRYLCLAVAAGTLTVVLPARSALLAAVLTLVLAAGIYLAADNQALRRGPRRLVIVGALPAVLVLLALVLPQTAAGSRLVSSTGTAAADDENSAVGTTRARELAWSAVLRHVSEQRAEVFGVGFGPDYLYTSGARRPLGNNPALRAPHNFLIGTYARTGLVGLVLFLATVAAAAREAVIARRRLLDNRLLLFAVLLPPALLTSALFGVELEAPFVAVPFYWCLGLLLSRPRPGRGRDGL